jgi:predicted alpha/beta-hydrolase family hydrolase
MNKIVPIFQKVRARKPSMKRRSGLSFLTGSVVPHLETTKPNTSAMIQKQVRMPLEGVILNGDLFLPKDACGIVIFAHGSGSSRQSPRNQYVAEVLHDTGLGTLLFDLLTDAEEKADEMTKNLCFNIEVLASRLVGATQWVMRQPETGDLPRGYFGASTGAGAALVAAARLGTNIAAVVSRGGRPDLAGKALADVRSPTLLIVGEQDPLVLRLNERAFAQMGCEKAFKVINGATHLFQEPGKLEEVAGLSANWFQRHLRPQEDEAQP